MTKPKTCCENRSHLLRGDNSSNRLLRILCEEKPKYGNLSRGFRKCTLITRTRLPSGVAASRSRAKCGGSWQSGRVDVHATRERGAHAVRSQRADGQLTVTRHAHPRSWTSPEDGGLCATLPLTTHLPHFEAGSDKHEVS